jgi:hypothetical protein
MSASLFCSCHAGRGKQSQKGNGRSDASCHRRYQQQASFYHQHFCCGFYACYLDYCSCSLCSNNCCRSCDYFDSDCDLALYLSLCLCPYHHLFLVWGFCFYCCYGCCRKSAKSKRSPTTSGSVKSRKKKSERNSWKMTMMSAKKKTTVSLQPLPKLRQLVRHSQQPRRQQLQQSPSLTSLEGHLLVLPNQWK